MIPIIIFIFALIIRPVLLSKAFESALTIGIGFTGVFCREPFDQ